MPMLCSETFDTAAAAISSSPERMLFRHQQNSPTSISSSSSSSNNRHPAGRNLNSVSSCYKLGEVIGSGSFSVVRSAVRVSDGASVAVKVSAVSYPQQTTALREVHLLRKASGHKSVAKFIEYFEEDGHIYLVTELVPGRDSGLCLADRGSYAEDDCRAVAQQLLSVLAHLHSRGIVHRDLKLENVVFGEDDDTSNLRLIDFGLAHEITPEEPFMSKPCGTPAYVAPEVLNRKASYGPSCDIWSLGVILFFLLCGEPPFLGDRYKDLKELVMAIRKGDYAMDDPAWELVSEGAKDFVMSLLAVDASRRPTAAVALWHPWLSGHDDAPSSPSF